MSAIRGFAHVVITRVEMPDDLQLARVLVRLTIGAEDAGARKRLMAGLVAASGLLRKRVGQSVGLRRAPELRFHYDEGQDASLRVEELLPRDQKETPASPRILAPWRPGGSLSSVRTEARASASSRQPAWCRRPVCRPCRPWP